MSYTISGIEFTLKPIKDLTFKEDQLLRDLLINENTSFYDLDLNAIFPLILKYSKPSRTSSVLPSRPLGESRSEGLSVADAPDFQNLSFELFTQIVSDFLSARQIFFLNLPNSIANSVQQNLKSSLNLNPVPASPVDTNQT